MGDFGSSNVGSQEGLNPDTGVPNPVTISGGQQKIAFRQTGKGRLNFVMVAINNKKSTVVLKVDGDEKIKVTPRRLYLLGTTNFNNYVWIEKYDETNDEYGVQMGRQYGFNDSFELVIISPESETTNLLDFNIFWETDIT